MKQHCKPLKAILQKPTSTTLLSLVCFTRFYQKKTLHLKDDKWTVSKHSKIRLTWLAAANMNVDRLLVFVIGKSKKRKSFKNFNVVTEARTKAGWIQHFSKIGSESLTINLKKKAGRLYSPSRYWKIKSNQSFLSSSKHDFCLTANGSNGHLFFKIKVQK